MRSRSRRGSARLGVVGIVYGSLACLAQTDLKRLIAYSSIGHMGFVVLAISTLTPQGAAAANFANVAHGAITGLLFFLVGGLKDRVGGTSFAEIGRGLYGRSPHLAGVLSLTALASLGLPGPGRLLGRDADHARGVLAQP